MTQDNEKLKAFKSLIKLFSLDPVFKKEIKKILFRGNLAYFIDKYYATDEWDFLYVTIQGLMAHSLYSDVCFLITTKSEVKFIETLTALDTGESLKNKKECLAISKVPYIVGKRFGGYGSIVTVGSGLYPDWFLTYENNLGILRNFKEEEEYI